MGKRRGNKTNYIAEYKKIPLSDQRIDNPRVPVSWLAEQWHRARARDKFNSLYEREKTYDIGASINGRDVRAAMEYLATMTGDDIFHGAALAMKSYGVDGGGLKQTLSAIIRSASGKTPFIVFIRMEQWISTGSSIADAARRTAVQLGLDEDDLPDGLEATFEKLTSRLVVDYRNWKNKGGVNGEEPRWPDGATGRRLRIRLAHPWLGEKNEPLSHLRGVALDADGYGIAPDDREWRRLIHDGHIMLCGIIEPEK